MRTSPLRFWVLVLAASVLALTLTAVPSTARSGRPVPFATTSGEVFLSQDPDNDTLMQLFRAAVASDGTVTYIPEGPEETDRDAFYNAIAFNAQDGFIYATDARDRVLRVGVGGVWELTGWTLPTSVVAYWGGVVAADSATGHPVYVAYAASLAQGRIQRVDLVTGAVTSLKLTGSVPSVLPYDLTYADGYYWGLLSGTAGLFRISPDGAVTTVGPVPGLPTSGAYGSAWTLGNGMPVFQSNTTGDFYQLQITDPSAARPTVAVVNRTPAPPASWNDGTIAPGLDADLSLEKSGPDVYAGPGPATYTFTVTNHGPGTSTGGFVRDVLPAGLEYAGSSIPCHDGLDYTACADGDLDLLFDFSGIGMGESATFTVAVEVTSTASGPTTNGGRVFGNEQDQEAENNHATTTMVPVPARIALDQAIASVTDTNGDGRADAGDLINLTFLVANESPVPVQDLRIDDPLLVGAGARISCPTTSLAAAGQPGSTTTCTASYVVTQDDVDSDLASVTSRATAQGTALGVPTNEPTDSVVQPLDQIGSLSLTKTADHDAAAEGQAVTYTLEATNTGTVTLSDVQIDDGDGFGGKGSLSPLSCVHPDGSEVAEPVELAPNDTVRCETAYVVLQGDLDAGVLHNQASASGTPTAGRAVTAAAEVDVAMIADTRPGSLPSTGAGPGLVLIGWIGALATALGVCLVAARRRSV